MATATSRRSAVAKPLKPFTLDHWRKYAGRLVLDTGEPWPVDDDPWMLEIVKDLFSGFREMWVLVPEGNAKTTLFAGVGLYGADFSRSPWIPIGAASRDQAEILFGQAAGFVERTPGLDAKKVKQGRFKVFEGYRQIKSVVNGGRGLKVYAADKATGDGVIPYPYALIDEPHRHRDLGLYRTWKGKLRKRGAQIAAISTAGEPGTDFEETRDAIRNAATEREYRNPCHLRACGNGVVMHEFKVPKAEQAKDLELVRLANPLSVITKQDLREKLESPTLDYGEDWLRLTCNIPARSSRAAVSDADWDHAHTDDDIPEKAEIDLGADFAWSSDTTAIQSLWVPEPTFRLLGDPVILEPPRDGTMLDPQEVKDAFDLFIGRYRVRRVVADKTKAQDTLLWLENERGVEVVDWSQTLKNEILEYELFMEALRGGASPDDKTRRESWLKHTGDPGLRKHVMNAIARKVPGDKHVFDRPSSSRSASKQSRRVIDCLKAAAMVHCSAVLDSRSERSNEAVFF